MVSEPPDLRTERCAGPQMLIWPPSTRSMRAVPDLRRTSLPLRRRVLVWPWMTSTLMGPLTRMDSPSMTPTESEGGSSGRGEAAEISAAQRKATQAAGNAARRQHAIELEKAVTQPYSQPRTQKVSPILYVGGSVAAYGDNDDTRRSRRGREETWRRAGECALRHAAAGFAVVAPHADSDRRGSGLQLDSNAGSDASLRSARLAACGAGVRGKKTVYLGLLAPGNYSGGVVVSKSRRRGDEHDCV